MYGQLADRNDQSLPCGGGGRGENFPVALLKDRCLPYDAGAGARDRGEDFVLAHLTN